MQFIVTARDYTDDQALDRRLAARQQHITLGNEMRDKGNLLYAVALLGEGEKMVGSVMVLDVPSRKDLDTWLTQEPYVTGKVWEKIDIRTCRVGPSFSGTPPTKPDNGMTSPQAPLCGA
jgi:uncharacterized protein YciI